MSPHHFLRNELNAACPLCHHVPDEKFEFICELCDTAFNPIKEFGKCPYCERTITVLTDNVKGGCGYSSFLLDWYKDIPEMSRVMLDETKTASAHEFGQRKRLESYLSFSKMTLYSELPFETILDSGGNSDCKEAFASRTTNELIEIFNSQSGGREDVNKKECRRMFILVQELMSRGLNFENIKGYNESKKLHYVAFWAPIELWANKVIWTIEGRAKYYY